MFGNKMDKIEKLVQKGDEQKLAALINDKSEEVCLAAIDAMGRLKGDIAFNALVPLLNSDSATVRAHAARALGAMQLPKSRTYLLHLREAEKDADVHAAIDEALKNISIQM